MLRLGADFLNDVVDDRRRRGSDGADKLCHLSAPAARVPPVWKIPIRTVPAREASLREDAEGSQCVVTSGGSIMLAERGERRSSDYGELMFLAGRRCRLKGAIPNEPIS